MQQNGTEAEIRLSSKPISEGGNPAELARWAFSLPWHLWNIAEPLGSSPLASLLSPPDSAGRCNLALCALPRQMCFRLDWRLSASAILISDCKFSCSRISISADFAVVNGCRFQACVIESNFTADIRATVFDRGTKISGDWKGTIVGDDCRLNCDASELSLINVTWEVFNKISASLATPTPEFYLVFGELFGQLVFDVSKVSKQFSEVFACSPGSRHGGAEDAVADLERSAALRTGKARDPSLARIELQDGELMLLNPVADRVETSQMKKLADTLRNLGYSDAPFEQVVFDLLRWFSDLDLEECASDFIKLTTHRVSPQSPADIYSRYEEEHLAEFFKELRVKAIDSHTFATQITNLGCALSWMQIQLLARKGPPVTVAAVRSSMPNTIAALAAAATIVEGKSALGPGWFPSHWEHLVRSGQIDSICILREISMQMFPNPNGQPDSFIWRIEADTVRKAVFERSNGVLVSGLSVLEEIYNLAMPHDSQYVRIQEAVSGEERFDLACQAMRLFFGEEQNSTPALFTGEIKLSGSERV